jgi:rod shape-determining protein MreD
MRWTAYLALAIGLTTALILQVGVLADLGLPLAAPDLLLVVVVAVAVGWGATPGMVLGFILGLASDLVPPATDAIGREAFVLCLVGYLAARAAPRVRGSALRQMTLIGCLAAVATFVYALVGLASGDASLPWSSLPAAAAGSALYAAVLAPFVIPVALFVTGRSERRRPLPVQRTSTGSRIGTPQGIQ